VLDAIPVEPIDEMLGILRRAYRAGAKVFALGNGGSAATASHLACDLGKNVAPVGAPRFKVVALTDNVATLTAWGNDNGYDRVFVEQLDNLIDPEDVVIAISASGNSPNVLRAVELARARDATVIGLTGFRGGSLRSLCDVCVVVPSDEMDQIEDAHLALQHLACRLLRQELSGAPV
jgi:D-sedoheptulose 7-phosphate isomerase